MTGTVEARFAPIHSAARMRDVLAVRRELAAGVDVDVVNGPAENGDGGNTALWFAAQGPWPQGVDVAWVLMEAGADVNKQCESPRPRQNIAGKKSRSPVPWRAPRVCALTRKMPSGVGAWRQRILRGVLSPGESYATANRTLMARERTRGLLFLAAAGRKMEAEK